MTRIVVLSLGLLSTFFCATAQQQFTTKIDTIYDLYTVEAGDNLYRIARNQEVDMEWLKKVNDLTKNDAISVGQRLVLPRVMQVKVAIETPEPVDSVSQLAQDSLVDVIEDGTAITESPIEKVEEKVEEKPKKDFIPSPPPLSEQKRVSINDNLSIAGQKEKALQHLADEQLKVQALGIRMDSMKQAINLLTAHYYEQKPADNANLEEMIEYMELTKQKNEQEQNLRVGISNLEMDLLQANVSYKKLENAYIQQYPDLLKENERAPAIAESGVSSAQKEILGEEAMSSFNLMQFDQDIYINKLQIYAGGGTGNNDLLGNVDSTSQIKARFYLARAIQELDAGNYKGGKKFVKKSTKLNPFYYEAWLLDADLKSSRLAFEKAEKSYNKVIALQNKIPQVFYNRAYCYARMENHLRAYSDFDRAIELDDEYLLAYASRGGLLLMDKNYESAKADFDRVVEINRFYSPGYLGRGKAELELGNYKAAIKDFTKVLEIDPYDAAVYYDRGMARLQIGELYDACVDFLTASKLGYSIADKQIKENCN